MLVLTVENVRYFASKTAGKRGQISASFVGMPEEGYSPYISYLFNSVAEIDIAAGDVVEIHGAEVVPAYVGDPKDLDPVLDSKGRAVRNLVNTTKGVPAKFDVNPANRYQKHRPNAAERFWEAHDRDVAALRAKLTEAIHAGVDSDAKVAPYVPVAIPAPEQVPVLM